MVIFKAKTGSSRCEYSLVCLTICDILLIKQNETFGWTKDVKKDVLDIGEGIVLNDTQINRKNNQKKKMINALEILFENMRINKYILFCYLFPSMNV